MIKECDSMDTLSTYVIQNVKTREIWSPGGSSRKDFYGFENYNDADRVIGKLSSEEWAIKKIGLFGLDYKSAYPGTVVVSPEPLKYEPTKGSVASKIKVAPGEHVLVCGEVQIGKLKEKHELIVLLREQYQLPVLVLFRNNNVDYNQFDKRTHEFNDEQRKNGKPTIPPPLDILSHKDKLHEFLKDPNVILGLANPETIAIVERCMDNHPELRGQLVIIMDEADLVTFELELEGQVVRTKTEENLRSLFSKIYMLISVTGTPASILMCDQESQVYVIDRPANYYGIDRIHHIPVQPVRAKKKYRQYEPQLDQDNLDAIFKDILALPKATLLLSVSRLRREHKEVIKYLSQRYAHCESVVYLELNEKSVKVYDSMGNEIDNIDARTIKGTKVGPIDKAITKYVDSKHIVIVAGVLAGRGVSFVGEKYERHLTHQYIADADGCYLESAMQSIRLLGKYYDDPELKLYCSDDLYKNLMAQCDDVKKFAQLAIQARENKAKMPDVIKAQIEYTRKWFAPRKIKGTIWTEKKVQKGEWAVAPKQSKPDRVKVRVCATHCRYRQNILNIYADILNEVNFIGSRYVVVNDPDEGKDELWKSCQELNLSYDEFDNHLQARKRDYQEILKRFPNYNPEEHYLLYSKGTSPLSSFVRKKSSLGQREFVFNEPLASIKEYLSL